MSDDRITSGADAISLSFQSSSKSVSGINTELVHCLQKLCSFINPLSVVLSLGCREAMNPIFDSGTKLEKPARQLNTFNPPHNVEIHVLPEKIEVTTVPNLTPEVMIYWVEKSINDTNGCPHTHQVDWMSIEIIALEVQLPSIPKLQGLSTLPLVSKSRSFSVPIEKKGGKQWVSGPLVTSEYSCPPPFYICLRQNNRSLYLDIDVNWSLWIWTNSSGYETTRALIGHFLERGWEISFLPPSLESSFRND